MKEITEDNFKHICSISTSIKEVITKLGGSDNGKWRSLVRSLSKKFNLDLPKYSGTKWKVITKECPVCKKNFETFMGHEREKITCSHSCSNTFFRSGINNGNYKDEGTNYRKTCIETHGSACLLCGFDLVIEAHHIDGNRKNNNQKNLVPLCPNHHRLIHTKKYKKNILNELRQKLFGNVV